MNDEERGEIELTPALFLVATPIGNLGDITLRAIEVLAHADVIGAEDTRRTRRLLSALGLAAGGRLMSVREHNEAEAAERIIEHLRAGRSVAYVSDAGTPAISDPGERLVAACVTAGVPVEAIPGPSAAIAALIVSALPTERFRFEGFLPRRAGERKRRIGTVAASAETVVIFESGGRVAGTLSELAAACGKDRSAVLARELTKLHEEVVRSTLAELEEWVASSPPRGEIVLVIAGRGSAGATDAQVDAAAAGLAAEPISARDAAEALAADLGIAHRRAYEAILRARGATATS